MSPARTLQIMWRMISVQEDSSFTGGSAFVNLLQITENEIGI